MKKLWRIFLAWVIHYDIETMCPECHEEDALHVTVWNWGDAYHDNEGRLWWWEGYGRCCKCGWHGPHGDA